MRRFTYQDRLKDMIISGGERLPGRDRKCDHRRSRDQQVAVIGAPTKVGESPHAIVVADQNGSASSRIVEYCGTRLARYKLPKKVIFAEAIPATRPKSKILKTVLRERYSTVRRR